mgnify:CR=1 FL=1
MRWHTLGDEHPELRRGGAPQDSQNEPHRHDHRWIDLTGPAPARPMRVKPMSGASDRRIVCWLKPGDEVERGARLGMIKLGSRTDILLPASPPPKIEVSVGTAVRGGITILARVTI